MDFEILCWKGNLLSDLAGGPSHEEEAGTPVLREGLHSEREREQS